ncbi:MAG TPA: DEAD/DEAH box helicase, partial [Candidatus Acidoferrum sp.]|nr:DEAD/DEAH box helicase [Candidatus Acidoferrum sp.]
MAKRAAKTKYAGENGLAHDAGELREGESVSFEDDPTVVAASADPETGEPTDAAPRPTMLDVFGPGGFLERCMIGGYEHRPGQLEMAEMVDNAFEKHQHAILEAGTGTGKTLAYLVPAICSGRRVVISTATKSLQEQLYQKDIPFLQKHF